MTRSTEGATWRPEWEGPEYHCHVCGVSPYYHAGQPHAYRPCEDQCRRCEGRR